MGYYMRRGVNRNWNIRYSNRVTEEVGMEDGIHYIISGAHFDYNWLTHRNNSNSIDVNEQPL